MEGKENIHFLIVPVMGQREAVELRKGIEKSGLLFMGFTREMLEDLHQGFITVLVEWKKKHGLDQDSGLPYVVPEEILAKGK